MSHMPHMMSHMMSHMPRPHFCRELLSGGGDEGDGEGLVAGLRALCSDLQVCVMLRVRVCMRMCVCVHVYVSMTWTHTHHARAAELALQECAWMCVPGCVPP